MAIAFKYSAAVRRAWLWLALRILLAVAACALAGWGVRESVLQRQLDYLSQQSRHRAEALLQNVRVLYMAGVNDVLPVYLDEQLQNVAVLHPIGEIMPRKLQFALKYPRFILPHHLIKAGVAFPV